MTSPHLTKEQILHLAELARLRLTDEEIAKFESELPKILELVAELQAAPTGDDENMLSADTQTNAFRSDTANVAPIGSPDDLKEAFLARDASGSLAIPPIFDRKPL